MIACCGLCCDECPALIASKENNYKKKVETAALWSELYNTQVKPEDINCDGCLSTTGKQFRHCAVCEIRTCARTKKLENCALCPEYNCSKLNFIFSVEPSAKQTLDAIRNLEKSK